MTPEDEAFEDIERRQGGFHAKRQAAMDKVNAEFDEEYIKYREAFPKGYTTQQVLPKDYTTQQRVPLVYLEQPAQEPVAIFDELLGRPTLLSSAPMLEEGQPFYTTPPKREWVGLTDEEREGIAQDYSLTGLGYQSPFKAIEAMLKEKNT